MYLKVVEKIAATCNYNININYYKSVIIIFICDIRAYFIFHILAIIYICII